MAKVVQIYAVENILHILTDEGKIYRQITEYFQFLGNISSDKWEEVILPKEIK